MPIGLAPEVTCLRPSRKIASARTVAVVVPSPASSLVLLATSRTICAPIFSQGSSNEISLDSDTVFGHSRRAIFPVEHDVAAFGSERRRDGPGQFGDAFEECLTS